MAIPGHLRILVGNIAMRSRLDAKEALHLRGTLLHYTRSVLAVRDPSGVSNRLLVSSPPVISAAEQLREGMHLQGPGVIV